MNVERQLMEEPRAIGFDCDVIEADEFMWGIRYGVFTEDGGHGFWACQQYYDQKTPIFTLAMPGINAPLSVTKRPEWATHVAWFNK